MASDGTYYQFLGQMAMMAMMAMVRLMENHRFEEVWNKYGLVGGFKYVLFSISYNIYIYIWYVILPIDELIFFRRVGIPPLRDQP